MVVLQGPFGLYAKNGIEIEVFDRAMQVLFLIWRHAKAPVIDRQIGSKKPVGLSYRLHPLEPHLLDQAVLEGVEEAFYPSLGLGRVGKEYPDAQLG
jgi:hypothetical protein